MEDRNCKYAFVMSIRFEIMRNKNYCSIISMTFLMQESPEINYRNIIYDVLYITSEANKEVEQHLQEGPRPLYLLGQRAILS